MQKPEQELSKEKTGWDKQLKKKYLEFITNHLISLEGRVPNKFFKIMENVISNSKTSRQFSDFHYHRKHGCSSMIDLINKVSKEIDQDPAVFIKNHEQTIQRQHEKISCFEGFKEAKSLTEVVHQEFLKHFNPYEIIFRPHKIFLNQIMLNEGKKEIASNSDLLHYRQLQTKLYPVKDDIQDSDQEKEKKKNSSGEEDLLSEELTNKKQIIFNKRQEKDQEKPTQTSQSKQSLTDAQYLKFLVFLMYYKRQFSNGSEKKNVGVWIRMSKFLKTRDSEGCKSCWQCFYRQYKDIDGVISYLQRTVNVSKEQIYEEISNIQDFYQQELERQMVSLNPVKLSLWTPGSNNESLILQIIKANIEFSSLTEKMSECKLEAGQQALKVQNQQIKVELPITFEVFLIKQSNKEKKDSNPKAKKKYKEKEQEDQNEDQNEDQSNIDRRQKIFRRINKTYETKKKSTKSQEVYFSDDGINDNKGLEKMKRNITKWSISQNLKFVAYLMVNRQYFENPDGKDRNGIIIKLAQFLQTDKNISKCSEHLSQWKLMNDKDVKKAIDQKAQKFGLTEQIIQERKRICRQIKTFKTKMGDATLQLDHLPTKICMKKEDFREETVLSKLYESEPYLSFYLRFQEKDQIEKKEADQQKKNFLGQEYPQSKGCLSQKIINANAKLRVPEQKFQIVKKHLEMNTKKEMQAVDLDLGHGTKKIKIQVNLMYVFIFN